MLIGNYQYGDTPMPLNESDTRSKLIDPALYARGWREDHIKREETAGAVEIVEGQARKRSQGCVVLIPERISPLFDVVLILRAKLCNMK